MSKPTAPIVVVDYDPTWPAQFETLRGRLSNTLGDLSLAIEHVGSTAVPGLAAKPIIDIDVVIESRNVLPAIIERLATIGYEHEGDLGIPGREAFTAQANSIPHHLYVCDRDNRALREHLLLRDYLRADPVAVDQYAALKRRLAIKYHNDRAGYTGAKSAWIRERLAQAQNDEIGSAS